MAFKSPRSITFDWAAQLPVASSISCNVPQSVTKQLINPFDTDYPDGTRPVTMIWAKPIAGCIETPLKGRVLMTEFVL
uniref:Uncharacterized protein n=1 Tax=Parascaris equorum TaxID=6256 RepID=A0A914RN60_PAREQ